MDLQELFKKVITTTPLEESEMDLAQFDGLSVSETWGKINEFLATFGLKIYAISSFDPTKAEFFEGKVGSNFEYNILGLRRLDNLEDTILFDDVTYLLGNCDKVATSKRMLVDFYKRVAVINYFGKLNEYCPHCNGEIEVAYKGFVIHQCPDCKNDLTPCSICDAYTDNEVKVYAQSCSQCPFDERS